MTRILAVKRATQRAVGPWKVGFDGSTESGIFPDWTPTGTDYTIEAVVTVGAIGADQYILCRGDTDNAWRLQFDSLNSFELIYPSSTVAQTITDSGTYAVGDEVSVKAIFSSTDVTLIVEGNSTTDTDDPDAAIAWGKVATNNDASGAFFDGVIEEVRLFDHDDTTNTRTYNMDEGYGDLCYDLTGPKTANTLYPVLNEKFDQPNPLDGWETRFGADLSVNNGAMRVTDNIEDAIAGRALIETPTILNQNYIVSYDFPDDSLGGTYDSYVGVLDTGSVAGALTSNLASVGSVGNKMSFVGTGSPVYLLFFGPASDGEWTEWDNITVQAAVLENGTFDSDISGWTVTETGTGTATWSSGAVVMTRDVGTGNMGRISQSFTTVIGRAYRASTIIDANDGSTALLVGTGENGFQNLTINTAGTGELAGYFIATATTTWVTTRPFANSMSCTIDNVIITPERGLPILLVGSPDWVNNAN